MFSVAITTPATLLTAYCKRWNAQLRKLLNKFQFLVTTETPSTFLTRIAGEFENGTC